MAPHEEVGVLERMAGFTADAEAVNKAPFAGLEMRHASGQTSIPCQAHAINSLL